jgi:hypothetical protein
MMHNTDYWIKKIIRVINWCTQFNIISKSGPVENCFNWILGSTSKKKKGFRVNLWFFCMQRFFLRLYYNARSHIFFSCFD